MWIYGKRTKGGKDSKSESIDENKEDDNSKSELKYY